MIKLFCDDCFNAFKNIPDKSIDMVLCDLPYGSSACKWDKALPLDEIWANIKRIRKDNAPVLLFGIEPFSTHLRMSNIKEYKYDWIWIKEHGTGFARSHKQPLRKNELISVFYKSQPYYDYVGEKLEKPITRTLPIVKSDADFVRSNNGTKENRKYVTYTHKTKDNVLHISRHTKGSVHPTQKPVALCEYLIKTYTKENDVVLDFTMGSGTTGIACVNTGRSFIGIEKEQKYFEIAKQRISEVQDDTHR